MPPSPFLLSFARVIWKRRAHGVSGSCVPLRAVHRAVQMVEEAHVDPKGKLEQWKTIRDQIHREVCERSYNKEVEAFTQYYGSDALDASILMMPIVGFLPPRDQRVLNTIAAIE